MSYLSSNYRFEVLEVDEIVEVEDVEVSRVKKLLSSLRLSKLLMKPLIVEEYKKFIIDGHHRFKALKMLGVRYVPTLLARYGVDVVDVGGWMYVADNSRLNLNMLLKIVEELEYLTKRGPDHLTLNVFGDQIKISVDRVDLYIALKYINIPLTKVPQRDRSSSNLSLVLPKLLPNDLYLLVFRGLKLPPRVTYHKTHLKHIFIPYSLNKLLRY